MRKILLTIITLSIILFSCARHRPCAAYNQVNEIDLKHDDK